MRNCPLLLLAGFLLPGYAAEAAPKPVPHTETVAIAGLPVTVRGSSILVDAGNNTYEPRT